MVLLKSVSKELPKCNLFPHLAFAGNRCRERWRLVESEGCWVERGVHPSWVFPSGTEIPGPQFHGFPGLSAQSFIACFWIQHSGQVEHQSMTFNSCCILSPGLASRAEILWVFSHQNYLDSHTCCFLNCGCMWNYGDPLICKFFLLTVVFQCFQAFSFIASCFCSVEMWCAGDKKLLLLSPASLEIFKSNQPQHVWWDKHQRGEAGDWLFPQNENKSRNAQFTDRQDLLIEVKQLEEGEEASFGCICQFWMKEESHFPSYFFQKLWEKNNRKRIFSFLHF